MISARSIRVRGVVQGVGFRPFVYRLAQEHGLAGWVLNGEDGVAIYAEGPQQNMAAFLEAIRTQAPSAAAISEIEVRSAEPDGLIGFTIRESERHERPTVRISPDLPVCDLCLQELSDPANRRYQYPYINCTNCGPRYTVIVALPYDRPEHHDEAAGRWTPTAMRNITTPQIGGFTRSRSLVRLAVRTIFFARTWKVRRWAMARQFDRTVELLRQGKIVAIKGLGGYHLACDARNPAAVGALRERKYRKEKPFAVMVKDLDTARSVVELSPEAETLLTSVARPIVLAAAKSELAGVAPDNDELGVMLPYTPLHHLLFAAGAPDVLVMTSANRSSEPIAYEDEDAFDAWRHGRRISCRRAAHRAARGRFRGARRQPLVRRSCAGRAATLPARWRICRSRVRCWPLGADLKNSITLVVDGQAFVSQHIGDLDHYQAFRRFRKRSAICLDVRRVVGRSARRCMTLIRNIFARLSRLGSAVRKARGATSSRSRGIGAG